MTFGRRQSKQGTQHAKLLTGTCAQCVGEAAKRLLSLGPSELGNGGWRWEWSKAVSHGAIKY